MSLLNGREQHKFSRVYVCVRCSSSTLVNFSLSMFDSARQVTIKPTRLPVVMLQYVSSTMPIPQNPGSNENFQTMPESSTTFY